MPPKANKIATAMAAVNKTVVKNYNAANRAINRAPAWVKWTIAAIAIAVIGYALWKLVRPNQIRERFEFAGATNAWNKFKVQKKLNDAGLNLYNINNSETGSMYNNGAAVRETEKQVGTHRVYYSDMNVMQAVADCDKDVNCKGFEIQFYSSNNRATMDNNTKGQIRFLGGGFGPNAIIDGNLVDADSDIWVKESKSVIPETSSGGGVKKDNENQTTAVSDSGGITGGVKRDNENQIPGFNLDAANKKVSATKGYDDFTGTGFDGVDFSGGATDHGQMSVEACVDKVRSGVISDMVYDKVNGKCYGKPINYDDIKEGTQTTFYKPNMYSASWHPSLKNMKISQDMFLLVNKIDDKRYWIDSNWEFKAVEGWKYKDATVWRMEGTGSWDGTKRIINSNGSARLAKPSTSEFVKIEHAGNNENYTHFTMENIPGTTDEYYLKNWTNDYVVAIKSGKDLKAFVASTSTPNGENFKWIKIPYFTA
jgi:hypothetical protein